VIAYNAVCPISAMGFRSPTLAQLMARYATTDPIFFSATADKRKGLSLIAPPVAKRRRTVKKVLIEVKFLLSLSQDYSLLINLILCDFRLEFSNLQLQNLPMLHLLVRPPLPFPQRSILAFTLNLVLAEETLVDHPVDIPVPQHISPPRAEPPAQVDISSSSGTQSPLLRQRHQPHQR
jgi:hypothetical protein